MCGGDAREQSGVVAELRWWSMLSEVRVEGETQPPPSVQTVLAGFCQCNTRRLQSWRRRLLCDEAPC